MTEARLRNAVAEFLDACNFNEVAFETQRAFSTESEAFEAAVVFWTRYSELYRAIGREPPATPAPFTQRTEGLI